MQRQWVVVLGAVALLGAGALYLIEQAPPRIGVGAKAPDFNAVDLATNQKVSLRDVYQGHVTLVNIWRTDCVPCKQEIPAMDSLYRDLHDRGFRIAAVSVDPGPDQGVRDFAGEFHISFDVLHDRENRVGELYQTTGVPESFLVDKTGHIVRIAQQAAPWNSPENHRIVEELLNAPAS
ncbi:MAG TPA: TlpA disulfide reductase family protein [Gemmatimonadales bacterium]|jgi:peroxiredoxin